MTSLDWADLAPDRQSPVPLYYQLAAAIREWIRAGALAPGAQLPAERELAERTGISRMTARQALADLARGGDVAVRHGVGTFVAEPKLTHDALHLLGFTEEMERVGGAVSSRVLEQEVTSPPPAIAAALDLQDGDETVRIVRLRSAAATPLLLETSWIPRSRCPGLERRGPGAAVVVLAPGDSLRTSPPRGAADHRGDNGQRLRERAAEYRRGRADAAAGRGHDDRSRHADRVVPGHLPGGPGEDRGRESARSLSWWQRRVRR